MKQFKHMPRELWPNEAQHVEYATVYRATHNSDNLQIEDFLPWNIENPNQKKTFGPLFQPEFGLSIFTDLQALKSIVELVPKLHKSTKAYAKGFTSINRGISLKENKRHHVEYFLFDYENNSPKDDFKIVEVIK
ncbi:MAG: hypothetical protein IK081_11195 [Lachnospiraceae bacterium]|nr:hypothetical protein [Lachnospiraceae bacterium]